MSFAPAKQQRALSAEGRGHAWRQFEQGRRPAGAASATSSEHQGGGGISSSDSAAAFQDREVKLQKRLSLQLSQRLPDAIGLLVRQPLQQLYAELLTNLHEGLDDASEPGASAMPAQGRDALSPLCDFVQRLLQALTELQHLFADSVASGAAAKASAIISWLTSMRDELSSCGQRAGKAMRSLAASAAGRPRGEDAYSQLNSMGGDLRSVLKESLSEVLRQVPFHYDQELSQLREELHETRSLAVAAAMEAKKQEAVAAANEASLWGRSLEQMLDRKLKEHYAVEEQKWHHVREEVVHGRAEVIQQLTEQQQHSVQQLSQLWAAQMAHRDRELRALQNQAEATMVEMRCSQSSAELAQSKAASEKQALELAEVRFAEELREEQLVYREAQARAREAAEAELARERRERGTLALQLTEAMDTVAARDRSINKLQSSLGELDRARPEPPVQMAMTTSVIAPRSGTLQQGGSGPIPQSPLAASMQTGLDNPRRSDSPRSALEPRTGDVHGQPFPLFAATEDGAGSVCRVSTESSPSVRANGRSDTLSVVPPLPRRRTVMEVAAASPERPSAKRDGQASVMSTVPERPSDNVGAAWDLSPQEFLAMWRHSRTASSPGSASKRSFTKPAGNCENAARDATRPPGALLTHSKSADTLRITASLE